MKKAYKNELYQAINLYTIGIENIIFRTFDDFVDPFKRNKYTIDEIRYRDSEVFFRIINSPKDSDTFGYWYTIKYPSFHEETTASRWWPFYNPIFSSFKEILIEVDRWLKSGVYPCWQEDSQTDIWEKIISSKEFFQSSVFQFNDISEFSIKEKNLVKGKLTELKKLLIERYADNNSQEDLINQKLEYIIVAIERLNKFDWKSIVISTIIGIITALSLDVEKGKELFKFFENIFKDMAYLRN